ncbi:MAG: SGNH/GDSL hydrolase family protein [Fibrobacteres bacterium]|nr:SGNH/GDSL hydrolase family protein [Fibrobacterota bacterium]
MTKELELSEVVSLFKNILSVRMENGGVRPLRFTEKQFARFEGNRDRMIRALSPAGVTLDFITDASSVSIGLLFDGYARPHASIDIMIDGAVTASVSVKRPMGEQISVIPIEGSGERRVTLLLPHTACYVIKSMVLENCTVLKKAEALSKRIISFGDSITQGMDALKPSSIFSATFGKFFKAEVLNLGVGGYVFDAELIDGDAEFKPDLITVAYGTNDWSLKNGENFRQGCTAFLKKLTEVYPGIPKIVITPFWRLDGDEKNGAGTLQEAGKQIKSCAEVYSDIIVVDGYEVSPHMPEFYGDLYLHPSDEGFQRIAVNILCSLVSRKEIILFLQQ